MFLLRLFNLKVYFVINFIININKIHLIKVLILDIFIISKI